MRYDLDILTLPTSEPVELDDLKLHLRVDEDDEDVLISALLKAAREYCERYTRRVFLETELSFTFDDFPSDRRWFYLPRSPLISIEQILYYDTDGVQQTLNSSLYYTDIGKETPARVILDPDEFDWPDTQSYRASSVQVDFKAGYKTPDGTADCVPEAINAAIKLLVGHWYENREGVVIGTISNKVPMTVNMLLDGYTVVDVGYGV